MRWFRRWYGANPLHLLVMLGCVTLAAYAGAALLQAKPVAVLIWFAGAIVGHDLILVPLYVLADRSVMTVFRHRPPRLPAVPWINYLRVPAALSGLLLLIWFPLIFRIPSRFPQTTDLSLNPYLGHWLAVTGVLFLLSAAAFALRLRPGRRRREAAGRNSQTAGHNRHAAGHRRETGYSRETAGHSRETAGHSRETAGHSRETAGHSRETAGHSRETAGHSRETAGRGRETAGQRAATPAPAPRPAGPDPMRPPWESRPPWE